MDEHVRWFKRAWHQAGKYRNAPNNFSLRLTTKRKVYQSLKFCSNERRLSLKEFKINGKPFEQKLESIEIPTFKNLCHNNWGLRGLFAPFTLFNFVLINDTYLIGLSFWQSKANGKKLTQLVLNQDNFFERYDQALDIICSRGQTKCKSIHLATHRSVLCVQLICEDTTCCISNVEEKPCIHLSIKVYIRLSYILFVCLFANRHLKPV